MLYQLYWYKWVLPIPLYTCIHRYKFENNEVGRILSCECIVLCYILEYSYIVQKIAKRRTSPVFAFNMQKPNQVECLIVFKFECRKQTQDLCVSLLFAQYSYVPMCSTKQYIYKNQGVFVKHYAPRGKSEKAIFSIKVKVKVTGSLTFVSLERASLVKYACKIWSLYLLRFKSYSKC